MEPASQKSVKFTDRNQTYQHRPQKFQALMQDMSYVSLVFGFFVFCLCQIPCSAVVAWAITTSIQKSHAGVVASNFFRVNSKPVWGKKTFCTPTSQIYLAHLGIWSHVAFSLPPLRHTCSHNWIHTHPIHRADICRPLSVEGGTSNPRIVRL